jgi:hypothetical protein
LYKYKKIEEVDGIPFRHIVAGAFFQMQKTCIKRLPEINTLINGDILYVDVFPVDPAQQILLSKPERELLLKQLGAEHYLLVPSDKWSLAVNELKSKNHTSKDIYRGPFFLSGLTEDNIDLTILKQFLANAFRDPALFEWSEHLGYHFPLHGTVVYGNQIGRKIGYPTINIKPSDQRKIIPPMGVYTGLLKYRGEWHQSMVNIGIRPTLDMSSVTIEAHVFDFSDEIYDQEVILHFTGRIRDEMRFPSLDSLKSQLDIDRQRAISQLNTLNLHPREEDDFLLTV